MYDPVMPSGYTAKARIGFTFTDATNKYPLAYAQLGRLVQYKVTSGSNLTALPSLATGAAGDYSVPTWAAVSLLSFVPPTATRIGLSVLSYNGALSVAPNIYYGTQTSANPPPIIGTEPANGTIQGGVSWLLLESASIYWASSVSVNRLACIGWEDNI
jgi:hypothetical protein